MAAYKIPITDGLAASQAVMTDANKKLVSANYLNQGVKTSDTPLFVGLKILEGGESPVKFTLFQGGDQAADITLTLPTALPVSNKFLQSTSAGVLSWETPPATGFGAWTTTTGGGSALVKTTVYTVSGDGFVVVLASSPIDQFPFVTVYTDSSNPPTTMRGRNGGNASTTCTVPVRSGDRWKVTITGETGYTIYWLPIGSGSCS